MATKKKVAKKTGKKVAKKTSKKVEKSTAKKAAKERGAPRACSECGTLGHNRRSHQQGGKLAA